MRRTDAATWPPLWEYSRDNAYPAALDPARSSG